jgi:uroporphyrinogen decarboxylase
MPRDTALMTKNDRVFAALRGEEVDRVPVSAWWHDYGREWGAKELAEATLEAYRRYDWDFVKVNPRATYYGEDWGARYEPRDGRQPELVAPAIRSPGDLARIRPLDVSGGAYGQQVEALRQIARELKNEAPFVQTVFSPLACLSRMAGSPKFVQKLMRENGGELEAALGVVAETLAAYARACLDSGASGIFYATVEWGSADNISWEDFERFSRPFDLRVLRAVEGAPFNILHVCRNNNHLLRLLDYPVSAFHWDVHGMGNPSLLEAAAATKRALMGGVSHDSTIKSGSPADVAKEAERAMVETRRRGFLLAPGCSVDPDVPEANLRTLAQVARS